MSQSHNRMVKKKSLKKSEKEQSLKSSTRKNEIYKLAQLTEILSNDLDPKFEADLTLRVKELSRKLFP